jgi:hexosaminidase
MFKKILLFILLTGTSFGTYAQEKEKHQFNLMPWPQKIAANPGNFKINEDFQILIKNESDQSSRIYKASTRFLRYIADKTGVFIDEGFARIATDESAKAAVMISFDTKALVEIGMEESYEMRVSAQGIEIKAPTDIGAMHALSTLMQLITVQEGSYVIPNVVVMDSPRFAWRGLFMDVARHFMPVDVVKRNLDAMAFVKLNVFHWHLSDDQGFRVETKSLPELYEKASDGQYYTHEQIKDIVKYADERGIRVVPEFDVPGHGTAFLTAYPELASKKGEEYTLERYAGIFDPTLDPTNEMTYTFLDKLFKEVTPLFPDQYFHIGGDENEGKHWAENQDIQEFMKKNKLKDKHDLQTYFNIKLEKILAKYNKSLVGWEEIMTENMPKSAVIQSWRGVNEGLEPGQSLVEAVKNGYQTILSNGYYIDLLLSVEDHYLVDPMPKVALTPEESKRILGGEVTMWSELVTPLTIDSRIWPRTAAIAERFWSAQEVQNIDDMYRRLDVINNSLELVGIRHLQVKEFLLRNIANYQNVDALRALTEISEPFKIYSRNAGGTEYKSFSPFTLFADACTADARDVRPFRALVNQYVSSKDDASKKEIITYLTRWSEIGKNLTLIEPNAPLVKRVLPYANRVGKIADLCLTALNNGQISQEKSLQLAELLNKKEDPKVNLDVELAVTKDLIKLGKFLEKN